MLTHDDIVRHPLGSEYRRLCWELMLTACPHPGPEFESARQRAAYEREAARDHGRCPEGHGWKNPANTQRLFNRRSG